MTIDISARIIFAFSSLLLVGGILQMIRQGALKEKYALLWLPLGLVFMTFGCFPSLLILISEAVHLHYITVVLLCVIVIFTYMLLYFTVRLSQMREDVKKLAQELALERAKDPRIRPEFKP